MSALIKAGHIVLSAERVPLMALPAVAAPNPAPVSDSSAGASLSSADIGEFTAEQDRLRARIAELEAALVDSASELERKTKAAFEQGEQYGREQVVRAEDERVAALRNGIAVACQTFDTRMAALDGLAAELALVGLERVLGDPTRYAELVVDTIRHRLASITAGSIVDIRVSTNDFPDPDRLESIRRALGLPPSVALIADPQLPGGECMIGLMLGKLDAGIPRQWDHVASSIREVSRDA